MKPTSFKESNLVLGAGGNPNTEDLVIARSIDNDGIPFVVSRWKLSKEELERINETGDVWLCIMGNTMPPVMPTVFQPFTEHGFTPLEM